MADASTRFGLPFILPGQAQKELFHNEALALVDAALHPAVEGAPLDQAPSGPGEGQTWLIGPSPVGSWAGHQNQLAVWTEGGWRFVAPPIGMCVWDKSAEWHRRWTGTGWNSGEVNGSALIVNGTRVVGPRLKTIASPSGGTTIDQEARAAVDAIVVALRSHGLIE